MSQLQPGCESYIQPRRDRGDHKQQVKKREKQDDGEDNAGNKLVKLISLRRFNPVRSIDRTHKLHFACVHVHVSIGRPRNEL